MAAAVGLAVTECQLPAGLAGHCVLAGQHLATSRLMLGPLVIGQGAIRRPQCLLSANIVQVNTTLMAPLLLAGWLQNQLGPLG